MAQMSRMDIRIPVEVRETIDFAASLEGRTRTDFLIEAATDKARKVISEHLIINLSLQDQKLLVKELVNDNVKEADEFIKGLADLYKNSIIAE